MRKKKEARSNRGIERIENITLANLYVVQHELTGFRETVRLGCPGGRGKKNFEKKIKKDEESAKEGRLKYWVTPGNHGCTAPLLGCDFYCNAKNHVNRR